MATGINVKDMRHVGSMEVLKRLRERQSGGYHVDPRLLQEVQAPGDLFLFTLQDEDSFLSLIWQAINPTRLLTPSEQPRTLRDVAGRMIENSWTFERLASSLGLPDSPVSNSDEQAFF